MEIKMKKIMICLTILFSQNVFAMRQPIHLELNPDDTTSHEVITSQSRDIQNLSQQRYQTLTDEIVGILSRLAPEGSGLEKLSTQQVKRFRSIFLVIFNNENKSDIMDMLNAAGVNEGEYDKLVLLSELIRDNINIPDGRELYSYMCRAEHTR
jgi:hypothetical protein